MNDYIITLDSMGGTHLEHRSHKYTKREWKNGKWKYWYDTHITGKTYKNQAAKYSTEASNYYRSASNAQENVNKTMNVSNKETVPTIKKQFRTFADDFGKDVLSNKYIAKEASAKVAKYTHDYKTKSLAGITGEVVKKAKTAINKFLKKLGGK